MGMNSNNTGVNNRPRPWLRWGLAGGGLGALVAGVALLSLGFDYDKATIDQPITPMVMALMAAGTAYFWISLRLGPERVGWRVIVFIIGVGVAMRVFMLPTAAMLEDDYYRYLWDGGVAANGFNPYKYSPEDATEATEKVPAELARLAQESSPVAERVNHPELRTIYPPVAQAAFVVAHWIKPWSLAAWRLVLFIFDTAGLVILILILRELKLPMGYLVIYWWNPLVVKDMYNSAHMDMLLFPLLLGALFLLLRKRYVLSTLALALAVGVKVWPVILLPIVLRPLLKRPGKLFLSMALFAFLSALMAVPIVAGGLDPDSGFAAYGQRWEMNDALFMLILWGVNWTTGLVGAGDSGLITRMLVGAMLVVFTLWLVKKNTDDPLAIADRFLFVTAALYLLSPTQFSWYSLWILPFLAVRPRASLLLLTVLVPMYYLRFYFKAIGSVNVHDYGIVWLEFVPVWALIGWEFYRERRARGMDPPEAPSNNEIES